MDSNSTKLYLVSRLGERHEDHIPCGVFTFDKFKENYPSAVTENDFEPNKWYDIYCLDIKGYVFSQKEIEDITSSKESFDSYTNMIGDDFNGEFYYFHVIQVVVNKEMDFT